jgi:predicted regulator of Ras-like GTPase activity (Roadblock/LC7/MglB family)
MIITEQDHARLMAVLEHLDGECNAKFVFLLDRSGQQIAAAGELDEVDPTSLASLTAGNVAATEGVAQLVGEDGFTTLFHEGKRECMHISIVAERAILLVVFDERSSLGLVRLRVEQGRPKLAEIIQEIVTRAEATAAGPGGTLGRITDADLETLFGE